jgi:hypothetical protein
MSRPPAFVCFDKRDGEERKEDTMNIGIIHEQLARSGVARIPGGESREGDV